MSTNEELVLRAEQAAAQVASDKAEIQAMVTKLEEVQAPSIAASKEDIKQALIAKGQTVDDTVPFSEYGNKVRAITGGGAMTRFYKCSKVTSVPGTVPAHSDINVNYGSGEQVLNMQQASDVSTSSVWSSSGLVVSFDDTQKAWILQNGNDTIDTASLDYSNITIGDGSKQKPYYWDDSNIASDSRTKTTTISCNNTASGSADSERQHIAVNLKAGTTYQIGMTTDGSDNKILLLDQAGSELTSADDTEYTIDGVYCMDAFSYTPTVDGLYIIAAGKYDYTDGTIGNTQVVCYPAPEKTSNEPSEVRPWVLSWANGTIVTEVSVPEGFLLGVWSGYEVSLGSDGYTIADNETTGLSYGTAFTPVIGVIYDELCSMVCSSLFLGGKQPLTFTAIEAGSTVKLDIAAGSPTVSGLLYSSDNGSTWNTYTCGTVITLANINDTVMFRNTEDALNNGSYNYVTFVMTGKIAGSGDVHSMMNYSEDNSACNGCYYRLFHNCTSLINAPEIGNTTFGTYSCYEMFSRCTNLETPPPAINAKTLSTYSCAYMFDGCTSLVSTPILYAENLAESCYSYMFQKCSNIVAASPIKAKHAGVNSFLRMFSGCTKLTTVTEFALETTKEKCCSYMFSGCVSLTDVPDLTANTVADGAYQNMFYNCAALTVAPKINAVSVSGNSCNSMFKECTSLTTAEGALPALKLGGSCYYEMFCNCRSLVKAPDLPATELVGSCYERMFRGCTSLVNPPEIGATSINSEASNSCFYMFEGCSSLNSAPELKPTILRYCCYAQMFEACISLVSVPDLPATSLAHGCYSGMFKNCVSLENAPAIAATSTSAYTSCNSMFNGCAKLNSIEVNFTSWENCDNWVYGVGTSGTFTKPSGLSETFGVSNIPEGWTVVNKD